MLAFLPGAAKYVLDVGCNSGAFGALIKQQRQIEVWGLEPHAESAQRARRVLDKVIAAPFDEEAALPSSYFDAVFFNDVLEHLLDPWSALRLAATKLSPKGVVIASIPNLRHVDNLAHILFDADFRYETCGIRDRTHLRFFTRKSAQRMFKESGYVLECQEGINANWWSPSLIRRSLFRMFPTWMEELKYQQFAFVARPTKEAAPASATR